MATGLNAGWVLTVLSERGFPAPDRDTLREALKSVDEPVAEKLRRTLAVLESGGGSDEQMEFAATVGRALSERVRQAVVSAGVGYRPGNVLNWALSSPEWTAELKRAADGDEEERRLLRQNLSTRNGAGDKAGADGGGVGEERPTAMEARATRGADAQDGHSEPRTGPAPRSYLGAAGARTHHVYGAKAALAFELDVARGSEGSARQFTLRIEGARAAASGARKFLWDEKIIIQLTLRELHQAAAVLLGARKKCEFSNHGEDRDKRCEISLQPGGVLVKLMQGPYAVVVPVGQDDVFPVALLATRALFMNDPDIDQSAILDVLRLTARMAAGD